MSDSDSAGFGKFVPGFDFLQNLAKGAGATVPQMPNLGSWVAPTLSVEELDKRIEELKNVQFWLEQNSRALSATIQALEVQRMTLATLKGMNFDLGDLARAFTPKAADKPHEEPREEPPEKTPEPTAPEPAAGATAAKASPAAAGKAASAGMVDALQLWGSLAQQFQHIAATALQDVSAQAAAQAAAAPAKKAAAKKAPVRKTAARKTGGHSASKASKVSSKATGK